MDQVSIKEPRSAIILVHGIGDQVQRSTLDSFSGLFRSRSRSSNYSQTLRVLDPHSKTEINRIPVVVAEMFWSDLSTMRTGLLSNLRNFCRLAADAPDIIYASLGPE